MSNTFAAFTLGCKVNQYETEAVCELLEKKGMTKVPFDSLSDVYIINTCSVTGESDRKNRQIIRRARKQNPDAVIAVMGCYSQVAEEEVKALGAADIIIGTEGRDKLAERIISVLGSKNESHFSRINKDIIKAAEYEHLHISAFSEHQRAFVKIQDGCDRFCTYCIIPYARGHIRSREPEDILEEIKGLANAGYKEIVLTGIHLASYGRDFKDETDLVTVLSEVEKISGVKRIRLGSLEPVFMSDDKIKALADNKKLCRQFHIALQSGSDTVLERMKRRYDTKDFSAIVEKIRKYMPDATFTTDIMTGFPGESEEEFRQSLDFVEKIGFSRVHVFPFSPRKGTKAYDMEDQIPKALKLKRAAEMAELGRRLYIKYLQELDGSTEEVLLEEKEEAGGKIYYSGHGKNYVKILIPESELAHEAELINSIKTVRLQLQNDTLYGTIYM